MASVTFDTLALARALRERAAFTSGQAEGAAEAIASALSGTLATTSDLDALERRLSTRMETLEQRMTVRLGGTMVVVGATAALVKLL